MTVRAHGPRRLLLATILVGALALAARPDAGAREIEEVATPVAAGKIADAGKAGYQVVDVEGVKGLLHKARGRVVVLHFWASWCYPCLQELPLIDKFAHDMKPRGLDLVSISLDDPARMGPRVAELLHKAAPHLTPTIVQFGDADELIGAVDPRWPGAIPALFAYDHRGQLRGNLIGTATRAELDALVAGLLKAAAAESPAQPAAGSAPASAAPPSPAPGAKK